MTFSPLDFARDDHDELYEVEPEIDEHTTLRCINEACGFSEEWHPEVEWEYQGVPPHGAILAFHVEDSLYCEVCGEPGEASEEVA